MDLRIPISDLTNPSDVLKLKNTLSEMADALDILYTETAPNGNISARLGRTAIYKNGSTYERWQNIDGATTWEQMTREALNLWQDDGDVKLKTANELDMQSKKIINLLDPTANQDASSKKYVDDSISAKFDTTTGHDHDGTDSKKVLATNLDPTGITDGQLLARSGSDIIGVDESLLSQESTADASGSASGNYADIGSVTKSITSGNIVFVICTFKQISSDSNALKSKFKLLAGAGTVQEIVDMYSHPSTDYTIEVTLQGIVTGLSGSTIFKLQAGTTANTVNVSSLNITVLEIPQ